MNLKTNLNSTTSPIKQGDFNSRLGSDERDKLVDLLKRNHDIVLEKYETQKFRQETLEKTAAEKEKLYNDIKAEND